MSLLPLLIPLVQAAAAAPAPMAAPLPPALSISQPRTPADSVYRLARRALEGDDLERAAQLFAQLRTRYPQSTYAADAGYWEGFSRYRMGGQSQLAAARAVLQAQLERYPRAATSGDARALLTRVGGQLARSGDAASAEAVAVTAEAAASAVAVARAPGLTTTTTTNIAAWSPAERGDRDDAEPAECRSADLDEKVEALNAFMQVDGERSVPVLARVLKRRDPCSFRLRRKAVFIVSQTRREGVEELLLEAVRTDPDRVVREQGVFWLGQVGTARAVKALDDLVVGGDDTGLRRKAIFAMSQLRVEGANERLAAYAARPDLGREVQGEALTWLGQRDGGAVLVRQLFPKLTDPVLKERAIFAVSQARDGTGARWLLDVARDEKQPLETRKKALFWAGQSRGVELSDLDAFYTAKDGDRDLKQQYAFVLSQRREPAAIDRLMSMAKSDADREVRKKAIFWLSQSRDPRVAKFLEDLIGNP